MFLEPFGLLAILPFPEWLRQFVPAYKATRIIAEVVIESLPQCLLQSYIYCIVLYHSKAGVASPSELAMVDFASVLPTSILISTIAMLKMWIEVVNGARAAGLSIHAKAIQLWEVGAGLPLDALKKGSIVEWKCPYQLEGPEIPPLIDALCRNMSLTHLDVRARDSRSSSARREQKQTHRTTMTPPRLPPSSAAPPSRASASTRTPPQAYPSCHASATLC